MNFNPAQRLDNILAGNVPLSQTNLDEWLQLVFMAMMGSEEAHLNVDIPYKGGLYSMHHCVTQINPPAQTGPILERKH